MQTVAQIEFQDMAASEPVREAIAAQIASLEKRYGRLTACRVVVRGPGDRHRNGGLYSVRVRLVLPGAQVDVGRTPSADERHADLAFALNDAFKRARRQLQDKVRRLQDQSKAPAPI